MHPIYGATLKTERAREKFLALKESIKPFRTGEAYDRIRRYDPGIPAVLEFLSPKLAIPKYLSVEIGEILHDLRSALDHVVFELARMHCAAADLTFDADSTQFPVFLADTGDQSSPIKALRSGFSDKISGQPGPKGLLQCAPAVRAHIKSLQPFATGEGQKSPLFQLHQLNNWDKHRTIYTTHLLKDGARSEGRVGPGFRGVIVGGNGLFDGEIMVGGAIIEPRDDMTLDEWASQVEVKGEFDTYVALNQPTPCAGFPVDLLVLRIGERVGRIIDGINEAFF